VTILVVAILTLAACNKQAKESVQASAPPKAAAKLNTAGVVEIPADSPKLEQIKVATIVEAEMAADEFTAPGKIELNPNRVSHVLLPVAGRVTEVLVKFGDSVRKDDALLTIESPEADAAASNFLQSEAAVTQAKANLGKAQADFDRATELFKSDAIAK
jgi:cobalt-zinc-cadmium efflux system membrane fusion protein